MGHTRLSERKEFLFVRTDRRDAKASSTGGCAIERRNWYLSNVGILGFGHAALYLGDYRDFAPFRCSRGMELSYGKWVEGCMKLFRLRIQ